MAALAGEVSKTVDYDPAYGEGEDRFRLFLWLLAEGMEISNEEGEGEPPRTEPTFFKAWREWYDGYCSHVMPPEHETLARNDTAEYFYTHYLPRVHAQECIGGALGLLLWLTKYDRGRYAKAIYALCPVFRACEIPAARPNTFVGGAPLDPIAVEQYIIAAARAKNVCPETERGAVALILEPCVSKMIVNFAKLLVFSELKDAFSSTSVVLPWNCQSEMEFAAEALLRSLLRNKGVQAYLAPQFLLDLSTEGDTMLGCLKSMDGITRNYARNVSMHYLKCMQARRSDSLLEVRQAVFRAQIRNKSAGSLRLHALDNTVLVGLFTDLRILQQACRCWMDRLDEDNEIWLGHHGLAVAKVQSFMQVTLTDTTEDAIMDCFPQFCSPRFKRDLWMCILSIPPDDIN